MDDIAGLVMDFYNLSLWMLTLLLAYIFLTQFTLINMLIGVLCEVVNSVSRNEDEKRIVNETINDSWSKKDKFLQYHRRSRYAEFNLLYDRGTKFGLETAISILRCDRFLDAVSCN